MKLENKFLQELAARFPDTDRDDAEILAEARERYHPGQPLRGLRRPYDAPEGAWYSVQPRKLADGTPVAYLMLRWHENNRARARSLGRLDHATT